MLYHGYLCDLEDSEMFPKLVAYPDYHLYITGESVSLTCLVPEEHRNESCAFHKDSIVILQNNTTYNIPRLDDSHVGIYTCIFRDRKSNDKVIHVYGLLPPPVISLQLPHMPDKTLTVTCSNLSEWKEIQIYKNGRKIFMATSFSVMAINEISISIQRTTGVYSCNYQTQKLGRLIDSQPSKNVSILGKKNRTMKTSFWMTYSTRRKSRKANPSLELPTIVHEKEEEESPYKKYDPCTTFMNPSSSQKPSNNQDSFHCVDPSTHVYDAVQQPALITPVST
ncbi:uncharacterized protein RB166_000153 [Leptodactylus fuscus]